jgi:hypothetical protein
MEKVFVKYCLGACAYGFVRTVAYAPPMKKEEYLTDRVGKTVFFTMLAPWSVPKYIYTDLKNLEHRARKMPGAIDRDPWV